MTGIAPPETKIGHVNLKVGDLDRAITFYTDVLGLSLTSRFGTGAAFLAAGSYHHHIGLNTWESAGANPPPAGHTGLHHVAFLYPDRKALAQVVLRAIAHDVAITGKSDHGATESVYFRDPDGNGVEVYRDRPEGEWPRNADGSLMPLNRPLDLEALLSEA